MLNLTRLRLILLTSVLIISVLNCEKRGLSAEEQVNYGAIRGIHYTGEHDGSAYNPFKVECYQFIGNIKFADTLDLIPKVKLLSENQVYYIKEKCIITGDFVSGLNYELYLSNFSFDNLTPGIYSLLAIYPSGVQRLVGLDALILESNGSLEITVEEDSIHLSPSDSDANFAQPVEVPIDGTVYLSYLLIKNIIVKPDTISLIDIENKTFKTFSEDTTIINWESEFEAKNRGDRKKPVDSSEAEGL